jgi:hypothetical protein
MHLHLALNILHFLPDLGALFTLRLAPTFCEIHPVLTTMLSLNASEASF